MATAKQFKLLFQLTAQLGPNFSRSFKNASQTMKILQNDLKGANRKLKDASAYQKQQTAVANSRSRVTELQSEYDRLVEKIGDVNNATKEQKKDLQSAETALAKAKNTAADEQERLEELGSALREAGVNTDSLGRDTNELRQQYERLEKSQKKVQEITEKQAANRQAVSQTKAQLGGLVGVVTTIAGTIYAGPVKSAMEWQQQMQNVATLLDGDVKGRVAQLNKEVMKLSNSTGIGTKDLTDGLYQVVSAFGDSAEASKQLEVAAKAAKAGGATTTDAINLLSAVTKGYGDTSAQAQQKAADLAFATVKLGQTSFPELASSIGQVIPLASTLGTKQEDLFGAMATLTGVTGSTSEVTTQLKATMQAFLSPSTAMQKSLEKLGYTSGKEMLESEGLQGALENLKTSVNGNELAFANLFSSVEAKNAVLALAGTQADTFTEKTKQMYEAAGAAETAFKTATDSTEERVAKAKNSISNIGRVLGNMLLPKVGETADAVAVLITRFSDFAQENPQLIATVAKVAAGLVGLKAGGLIARLGFLQVQGGIMSVKKAFAIMSGIGIGKYMENAGKGTKILIRAFEKIRGSGIVKTITQIGGGFGGILTKILPLAGVIAAVGGAVWYVSTHLEQVRGFIQKTFGNEALAAFNKLAGVITQAGTAVKGAFFTGGTGILDTLKSILPTVINTLKTGLLPILPVLANMVIQILPLIGQLVTAILPALGELAGAVMTVLATLAAEILPVIAQLISAILPLVLQIVQAVLPVFIDLVNTIVPVLAEIAQAVLPVIIQLVQTILPIITQIVNAVLPVLISMLNTIVPIFQNIIQAILPVLQQLLQALMPVVQMLAGILGGVLGSALKSIVEIVQNVMSVFRGLIDFITGVFTGNWTQAWNGIKTIFKGAVGGLGEIIKAPLRVIVSAVNAVIGGLNKLKVPDWVPGIGGKGINIPQIPGFVNGTARTPDTFIAGENGPELITGAANRSVFTAAQTNQIFNNMAQAQDLNTASNVNAGMAGTGTVIIRVSNSPTVYVKGGETDGIREQLQQYDEEFLEKLREIIRTILKEQKEKEDRVAYA